MTSMKNTIPRALLQHLEQCKSEAGWNAVPVDGNALQERGR